MKVLVAGHDSPLGRRVVLGLQDRHELVLHEAVDRCTPDRWGDHIQGVEVAVNLAERCQAPEPEVLEVVLKGTQSLLHGFGAYGAPRRLIHLSTALIGAGTPDEPDVDPKSHGSAWLAWKSAAEARVNHWTRRTGVEAVVVRSGHPFGAVGVDGPLTGWLEAAAASAESSGRFAVEHADVALPFVHVDELARSIVARVDGEPMPGEKNLVANLHRVDAVGLLASLGQVHRKLCQRTERKPVLVTPRTPLGERLQKLVRQGDELPRSPRYLRRAPIRRLDPTWAEAYGHRGLDEVVEALVGGAC